MDVRDAGVQLHDPSAIVAEWFYLYANWDMCCIGAGATYNIRVGRSRQITGPNLDAAGKDMELGGGTLVIGAKDAHGNSASGHAGVLELRHASNRSDRRLVLSSHYYLAHGDGRGLSFLQWHELEYDAAGWPRLGARHVPKREAIKLRVCRSTLVQCTLARSSY